MVQKGNQVILSNGTERVKPVFQLTPLIIQEQEAIEQNWKAANLKLIKGTTHNLLVEFYWHEISGRPRLWQNSKDSVMGEGNDKQYSSKKYVFLLRPPALATALTCPSNSGEIQIPAHSPEMDTSLSVSGYKPISNGGCKEDTSIIGW